MTIPFLKESRAKFTKEFKEAIARSVQEGTPVKQIARIHSINPAVVRGWRDELLALGDEAFSQNGKRRRFTKEFKEAAVLRVQQGTPVKEVARACRISPNKLRRWRDAKVSIGAEAFSDREPKFKAVIFRVSPDELDRLKARAKAASTSVSEFIRSRLLR
jgi:transposase-like protein